MIFNAELTPLLTALSFNKVAFVFRSNAMPPLHKNTESRRSPRTAPRRSRLKRHEGVSRLADPSSHPSET